MPRVKLTSRRLREVFRYEPETGKLFWRISPSNYVKAGSEAGSPTANGYLRVGIDGRYIMVHIAIFMMETGRRPRRMIDHEDRDKKNNRWGNLREATRSQNGANATVRSDNKSGFKGVSRHRSGFQAHIRVRGNGIYLGVFKTAEAAHAAYAAKAKEVFGEFRRFG